MRQLKQNNQYDTASVSIRDQAIHVPDRYCQEIIDAEFVENCLSNSGVFLELENLRHTDLIQMSIDIEGPPSRLSPADLLATTRKTAIFETYIEREKAGKKLYPVLQVRRIERLPTNAEKRREYIEALSLLRPSSLGEEKFNPLEAEGVLWKGDMDDATGDCMPYPEFIRRRDLQFKRLVKMPEFHPPRMSIAKIIEEIHEAAKKAV